MESEVMESDILERFSHSVFFHGTSLERAASIAEEGFRAWFQEEDERPFASFGNLGVGVYLTCNWRIALWFGPTLLRAEIRPGTRILNAAVAPDAKLLTSLQREFGRDILRRPPWLVLPKNKRLTLRELVALFRYHYWNSWEKDYGTAKDGGVKWTKQRDAHFRRLLDYRKILIRYGFHGFGNPRDDNGVVIFAPDRVALVELIAQLPGRDYMTLWDDDFRRFATLDDVQAYFDRFGSEPAKQLAAWIAARGAGRAR